jgi:hypothetical protein
MKMRTTSELRLRSAGKPLPVLAKIATCALAGLPAAQGHSVWQGKISCIGTR